MNFLSLCSGCGGMDLGLERAGLKCVGQVEIMPYALKVLSKHWPTIPKHTDILTLLHSDFPAKTYLKQTAKDRGLKAKKVLSSLSVCGLSTSLNRLGYSLRMFPDSFPLTRDGIWQQSFKRWPKAATGGRIDYATVNISESPNDAVECLLSDVLEEFPNPKYYLSKKAVAGMIRRSKKWGRGGYVFLLKTEKDKTRQLKLLSLQRFESIVTGSEAPQEGTLPLYGKTLILRKLTPEEKEQLQGFPPRWTLIGE